VEDGPISINAFEKEEEKESMLQRVSNGNRKKKRDT